MSTVFTIWCDTCEVAGPNIRRHHDGALLLQTDVPRFFPVGDKEQASLDWGAFLIAHEWHDIRLMTERHQQVTRAEQEAARQAKRDARPKASAESIASVRIINLEDGEDVTDSFIVAVNQDVKRP